MFYNSIFFAKPSMDFIQLWHDDRALSKILCSTIPILKIKVTDFEFFCVKSLQCQLLQTLWLIWIVFGMNGYKILKCFRKEKRISGELPCFFFLNLQWMGKVIRAFCWHQKFVPKGLYAMGLYTCIKSWKMCIKSDFEEIILKLATYGQREEAFLLSSKFYPQCIICPCPGLYTCGKTWKNVYKIRLQRDCSKTCNKWSKWWGLSVDINICPGAIYMYKSIKIYTRTRCQVSVYRTIGPLVKFSDCIMSKKKKEKWKHKFQNDPKFSDRQV